MSSLEETLDFNQEAINEKVEQIRKDCVAKGDEYCKQQIQEFGVNAKKLVVDQIRDMTTAYH